MIINISKVFMLQSYVGMLITFFIYAIVVASVDFSSDKLKAKHYALLTCLIVPLWAWILGLYTINFY
jgi:hypothetical protein